MPVFSRFGEPLSEAAVIAAAVAAVDPKSARRQAQAVRWRILKSLHHKDIVGHIIDQVPSLVSSYEPFVSVALNPASDIVHAISSVYDTPPQRTARDSGDVEAAEAASEKSSMDMPKADPGGTSVTLPTAQVDAMSTVIRESRIDAIGSEMAPHAWFVGPTALVPQVRRGRLRIDPVLSTDFEPILDEEDPLGDPVGIGYRVNTSGGFHDLVVMGPVNRWRVRVPEQMGARGGNGGGFGSEVSIVGSEPHGYSEAPFAIMRFTVPLSADDWWMHREHERLVSGTRDVGRIYATMGFVRRTQNKFLLALIGDVGHVADGQNLAGDQPLFFRTPSGRSTGDIILQSLPFNTSPDEFLKEIAFTMETMAGSIGVPVKVDGNGFEWDHEALSELRSRLVWHAEKMERDLWRATSMVVASSSHHTAALMPDPDALWQAIQIVFPKLTRKMQDPRAQREQHDWDLAHLTKSYVDIYRHEVDPHATRDEALAAMLSKARLNGYVQEVLANRNQPKDDAPEDGANSGDGPESAEGFKTVAQINGEKGPKARDSKPKDPSDPSKDAI